LDSNKTEKGRKRDDVRKRIYQKIGRQSTDWKKKKELSITKLGRWEREPGGKVGEWRIRANFAKTLKCDQAKQGLNFTMGMKGWKTGENRKFHQKCTHRNKKNRQKKKMKITKSPPPLPEHCLSQHLPTPAPGPHSPEFVILHIQKRNGGGGVNSLYC